MGAKLRIFHQIIEILSEKRKQKMIKKEKSTIVDAQNEIAPQTGNLQCSYYIIKV